MVTNQFVKTDSPRVVCRYILLAVLQVLVQKHGKLLGLLLFSLLIIGTTSQSAVSAQKSLLPVIVSFSPWANAPGMRAFLGSVGGTITHEYSIINGVAVSVPEAGIKELRANPSVQSVDPDVEVKAADLGADTQIHADQVWASGYTGSGVRLAILDTGIATQHPEFAGRIVACNSEVKGAHTCEDDNGHGTHVAGIAGAQGVNSAAKGVAPGILLMSDKVLNKYGSGSLSQVIAGIDWAVTNNAAIISMSLGTSPADGGGTQSNCDGVYPTFTSAIDNAVARGVTVVAAAGNSGTSGLGAPGCIGSVIAVGAVDGTDALAGFSSQGAAMRDHGIVAPGVSIFSAWPGGYATLSGTSMATPVVAGTVALMLSRNSSLTPSSLRAELFSGAACVASVCPNNLIGHGRVDAMGSAKSTNMFVQIGSPTDGATVSRFVGISVLAGGKALQGVDLYIDGKLRASGSGSFTYSWNSKSVPDGIHVITAQAHDANAGTAKVSISVVSNNGK